MEGAELIVEAISQLGELTATPQLESVATYAKKIQKSEARVNWFESARSVDWRIRGLSPTPGAWSEHSGVRIKLLLSCPGNGSGEPGTFLTIS